MRRPHIYAIAMSVFGAAAAAIVACDSDATDANAVDAGVRDSSTPAVDGDMRTVERDAGGDADASLDAGPMPIDASGIVFVTYSHQHQPNLGGCGGFRDSLSFDLDAGVATKTVCTDGPDASFENAKETKSVDASAVRAALDPLRVIPINDASCDGFDGLTTTLTIAGPSESHVISNQNICGVAPSPDLRAVEGFGTTTSFIQSLGP